MSGDIRLAEGTSPLEGRVEICYNDFWSTICHNGWDSLDARVVCRQLGFSASGTQWSPQLLKLGLPVQIAQLVWTLKVLHIDVAVVQFAQVKLVYGIICLSVHN